MRRHVRIFAGGGGRWGLGHDSRLVAGAFRGWTVEHCDSVMWQPRADTTIADIHVYLETPMRLAVPWGRANVLVVNPEWFPAAAWNWALAAPGSGGGGMDTVVFKSRAAAALFPELEGKRRSLVIPWRSDAEITGTDERWSTKERRFLYIIGGSPCKTLAARAVVATWRAAWPPLEIWCSPGVASVLRPLVPAGARVEFQTEYRPAAERVARQRACAWHVVVSAAEGFGMTAAEAVACGAPMLWSDLPVLRESWWGGGRGPGCVTVAAVERKEMPELAGVSSDYRRPMREGLLLPESPEAITQAVEELLALTEADVARLRAGWREARSAALRGFRSGWERVAELAWRVGAGRKNAGLPVAPAAGTAPPHVAVVTLTRGRQRAAWWPVMRENVRRQRWPAARLEWIVVGEPGGDPLEPVVREWARSAPFVVRWATAEIEAATVGAKRNAGVRAASAAATVFMMMDDDDHYPEGSVATRVSWLAGAQGRGAVYCSTLPMYDLRRYVSAMNVPPQVESPAERVSEATLAFTRAFWEARAFPDVGMAEGHGFLDGEERIRETVEIPPGGVIVSFIHGGNSSSRRVPADQEPNGCHWGFSDEYFELVHRVAATR